MNPYYPNLPADCGVPAQNSYTQQQPQQQQQQHATFYPPQQQQNYQYAPNTATTAVYTGVEAIPALGSPLVAPQQQQQQQQQDQPSCGGGGGGGGGVSCFTSTAPGEGMPTQPVAAAHIQRDVRGEQISNAVARDIQIQDSRIENCYMQDVYVRNSMVVGGAWQACTFKSCQIFDVKHMYGCRFEDCSVDNRCVVTRPTKVVRTELPS